MSSPLLWYATRATGLMALVLLTLGVVLGVATATRGSSTTLPGFIRQDLHRRVSVVSLAFLVCHVLTAVLDTFVHIGWAAIVVPFTSGYARWWVGLGAVALDLLVAVAVSSLLRPHIDARVWRGLHWLAYLCWPVAVTHAVGIGTDLRLGWVDGLVAGCIATVLGSVGWRVAHTVRWKQQARTLVGAPARGQRPPTKYLQRQGSFR